MSKTQGNKNITLMDNYNYTVYVPTNESIHELIEEAVAAHVGRLSHDCQDEAGHEDHGTERTLRGTLSAIQVLFR